MKARGRGLGVGGWRLRDWGGVWRIVVLGVGDWEWGIGSGDVEFGGFGYGVGYWGKGGRGVGGFGSGALGSGGTEAASGSASVRFTLILGFTPIPVTQVRIVNQVGIYAPMTRTGTIVVNGIMASCHNIVKSQSFVHTLLQFVQTVEQSTRNFFSSFNPNTENEIRVPTSIDFLHRIAKYFLPEYVYESHHNEL